MSQIPLVPLLATLALVGAGPGLAVDLAGTGPAPSAPASAGAAATVARAAYLMGTRLELELEAASRAEALAASEAALEALSATEARLSTWSRSSELARLNRAPVGVATPISVELWRELSAARGCSLATDGAFDPTVGSLVQAWGLRTGGRRPSEGELAAARAAVGVDGLVLDSERPLATRLRAGLAIEEGAFGKGAGLDRALERLVSSPGTRAAVIDLGGQVAVWRSPSAEATPAPVVAVADPERRDRALVSVAIERGSLATTGSSERAILVDGVARSHVLDPRSGLPTADLGSVTVWAESALVADCLSTALYVMGEEGIARFAAAHPEIGVVLLSRATAGAPLRALVTGALAGRVVALAPGVEIEVRPPGGQAARALEPEAMVVSSPPAGRRELGTSESVGPRPTATRREVRRSQQRDGRAQGTP